MFTVTPSIAIKAFSTIRFIRIQVTHIIYLLKVEIYGYQLSEHLIKLFPELQCSEHEQLVPQLHHELKIPTKIINLRQEWYMFLIKYG